MEARVVGLRCVFKHFNEIAWSLPQFNANSTLQKRYQREPMERIALPVALCILSKRVNRIYLLHFTLLRGSAERVPFRTSSPSVAPRHTPLINPAHAQNCSSCFFLSLSLLFEHFVNAAHFATERTGVSHAVRVLSHWRRLLQPSATGVCRQFFSILFFLSDLNTIHWQKGCWLGKKVKANEENQITDGAHITWRV